MPQCDGADGDYDGEGDERDLARSPASEDEPAQQPDAVELNANDRRLLALVTPALLDLRGAITHSNRINHVRMCEELIGSVVRMVKRDFDERAATTAAGHWRRRLTRNAATNAVVAWHADSDARISKPAAAAKHGLDPAAATEACIISTMRARDIGRRILAASKTVCGSDHVAPDPEELQAWRTLASHHRHVAMQYGLPDGALSRVAAKIAAALGDNDVRAHHGTKAARTLPQGRAGEALMLRTFHGLRLLAASSAGSDAELHAALAAPCACVEKTSGHGFVACWSDADRTVPEVRVVSLPTDPDNPQTPFVRLWIGVDGLLAVEGDMTAVGVIDETAVGSSVRTGRVSRFLPPEIRWPDTNLKTPDGAPIWSSGLKVKGFCPTGVMRHARAWHNKIPFLNGACRTILAGRMHIPTVPAGIPMGKEPNLSSIDNDMPLLRRLFAKYLISGVLEWCPPDSPPTNLIPLGLVPKNDIDEPWRAILDGRRTNLALIPMKVTMHGIRASSSLFRAGSYVFIKDVSAAYHNCLLGSGCTKGCLGCRGCKAPTPPTPGGLDDGQPVGGD